MNGTTWRFLKRLAPESWSRASSGQAETRQAQPRFLLQSDQMRNLRLCRHRGEAQKPRLLSCHRLCSPMHQRSNLPATLNSCSKGSHHTRFRSIELHVEGWETECHLSPTI